MIFGITLLHVFLSTHTHTHIHIYIIRTSHTLTWSLLRNSALFRRSVHAGETLTHVSEGKGVWRCAEELSIESTKRKTIQYKDKTKEEKEKTKRKQEGEEEEAEKNWKNMLLFVCVYCTSPSSRSIALLSAPVRESMRARCILFYTIGKIPTETILRQSRCGPSPTLM